MKKTLAVILALCMVLALCACGAKQPAATQTDAAATPTAQPVNLIVFAAASMQETLTELGDKYTAAHPEVTFSFNFDSSGTLLTQISEGADCDLFISAGQKQMNALDGSMKDDKDKNPDGLDLVLQGTRVDLLENKVALAVPEGNPAKINSFDDLKAGLQAGTIKLAMGNSDVPVGQYTQKILKYLGLDETALAKAGSITYGSNVKEVTTQVSEATVDCGIIYQTDAFSANLTIVDTATKDMCGQVIYPAALINTTKNQEAAQAFLDYLKTDEATQVFEKVGFTMVK
jgi:molybdate transport system substrate-binding protein